MAESAVGLDEVVVVGYGTQKKATLTGAVSDIKSSDIVTTKNENPENMLAGKISGVRIVQKSSEPGAFNTSLDIRGLGTPLIIIDGVPRSNIERLNADDIESMSVLKDASASVYGVRAANGVIVITTKRGNGQALQLNYSANMGWQIPAGSPKSVNAADWMMLANEKNMHNVNGGSLRFTDAQINAYRSDSLKGTDWYNAVMRSSAPQTQHTLSATGGDDRTNYYMSVGYMSQQSFLKSNDLNYNKYSVRSNITSKLTKQLTIDLNLNGITDIREQPQETADWIIRSFQRSNATQPIYANNNPAYVQEGFVDGSNPISMMDASIDGYKSYRNKWFQSSISLNWELPFIKGLNLKGMFSYDYQETLNKIYYLLYNQYNYDAASDKYTAVTHQSPSTIRDEFYSNQSVLYQASLNYSHRRQQTG
jgi:TonB-linked SusC/RagA family outer membrane protein